MRPLANALPLLLWLALLPAAGNVLAAAPQPTTPYSTHAEVRAFASEIWKRSQNSKMFIGFSPIAARIDNEPERDHRTRCEPF